MGENSYLDVEFPWFVRVESGVHALVSQVPLTSIVKDSYWVGISI